MKKIVYVFLSIVLSISFTACSNIELSMANNIVSPKSTNPIIGYWEMKKYISKTGKELPMDEKTVNYIINFDENQVEFPDEIYKDVRYKAKIVNSREYIYENYGILPRTIGITTDSIKVITINCKDIYLKDIIYINDNEILMEYYGSILFLEKLENHKDTGNLLGFEDESIKIYKALDTGVLLGLTKHGNDKEESTYRTMWLTNEGEVKIVKDIDILVPRKNGFWIADSYRIKDGDRFEDRIEIHPIGKAGKNNEESKGTFFSSISRNINFISDNYISMEVKEEYEKTNFSSIKTMTLDSLYNNKNEYINLESLIGQNSINMYVNSHDNKGKTVTINKLDNFMNYGIRRSKGIWRFYTTLKDVDDKEFEIPIGIPETVVNHNELYMNWDAILNIMPSAIDAIVSPNKNMIVIQTKNNLYMYKIHKNVINQEPMAIIPIDKDETIIMAEWAMGEYVNKWSEVVRGINVKK